MTIAAVAVGALTGLAVGLIYFALLRRAIDGYVGTGSLQGTLTLTALRLVIAIAAFWLLVQWSAAAAIAGLVGFTLARFAVRPTAGAS